MLAKIGFWAAHIIPALILLQTAPFKLLGLTESVEIFTTLGVEPWGRIILGIIEVAVAILTLIPATALWGGIIGVVIMLGAIGAHLFTPLGIAQNGDFSLFALAIVALMFFALVVYLRRKQFPIPV